MKLILIIRIILLILITSFSISCFSQNWPKIYGDNIMVYGQEIIESYDKGYLICGEMLNNDGLSFEYGWLIKTDINGNILWDKKFGDASYENYFSDFDKTPDNGLIISGSTAQQDVEQDPLFIKLNACGEIEWCKILLSEGYNTASGIVSLPNGENMGMLQYYGGDYQHIRISLVKMDSSGEPIWIKNLAQQDSTIVNEEGYNIYLTNDGNYLVSGRCFSPSKKPFFIKTDNAGEQIWDIKWPVGSGGVAGQSAFASNNFIYNASYLRFTGHPQVPYLLKYTENGEVLDQYPLMGDSIDTGGAVSILLYNDSVLFTGTTWTYDNLTYEGYCDILKIDTLGDVLTLRRLLEALQAPTSIIKSYDNKIITIGTFYVDSNFDIYLWKMNSDLEDDSLYTQPITYDSLCPHQILSDTVNLDCSLFVNIKDIPTKEEYESTIKISPNPAGDWIALSLPDNVSSGAIDLAVYNIFGQKVMKKTDNADAGNISWNISSLSAGFYFVTGRDKRSHNVKGKFVVAR